MHVPPKNDFSTSATVHPASVSFDESGFPACPEPMMMASYFICAVCCSCCVFPLCVTRVLYRFSAQNQLRVFAAFARFVRFILMRLVRIERELVNHLRPVFSQISAQRFIGKVDRPRMLPVMFHHARQPADNPAVVHLDSQLAPLVKTSRRQIHRAHNRALAVSQNELRMQLQLAYQSKQKAPSSVSRTGGS